MIRREQGFTMIEVIITTVILAIIVLSIAAFFSFELKSWVTGENKAYAVQKARLALNGDLMKEVKNPGLIPEIRRLDEITKAQKDSIEFLKVDYSVDPPDTHTITYSLEPDPPAPTGCIRRIEERGGDHIANAIIADSILFDSAGDNDGFILTYFAANDTAPLPSPPPNLNDIHQIRVEIKVDTNEDGEADFSLASRAMLRNRKLQKLQKELEGL